MRLRSDYFKKMEKSNQKTNSNKDSKKMLGLNFFLNKEQALRFLKK